MLWLKGQRSVPYDLSHLGFPSVSCPLGTWTLRRQWRQRKCEAVQPEFNAEVTKPRHFLCIVSMIMNSEQVGIWKEAVVAFVKVYPTSAWMGKSKQKLALQVEYGRDLNQAGLLAECQSTNALNTRSSVVRQTIWGYCWHSWLVTP